MGGQQLGLQGLFDSSTRTPHILLHRGHPRINLLLRQMFLHSVPVCMHQNPNVSPRLKKAQFVAPMMLYHSSDWVVIMVCNHVNAYLFPPEAGQPVRQDLLGARQRVCVSTLLLLSAFHSVSHGVHQCVSASVFISMCLPSPQAFTTQSLCRGQSAPDIFQPNARYRELRCDRLGLQQGEILNTRSVQCIIAGQ
jgi:hypothetical protein